MGNHIVTKPQVTAKMYLTADGKSVVYETIIRDVRPLKYYHGQLFKDIAKK